MMTERIYTHFDTVVYSYASLEEFERDEGDLGKEEPSIELEDLTESEKYEYYDRKGAFTFFKKVK